MSGASNGSYTGGGTREALLGGGIALGILEAVIGVKCIIRKRLRQSDEERVENG